MIGSEVCEASIASPDEFSSIVDEMALRAIDHHQTISGFEIALFGLTWRELEWIQLMIVCSLDPGSVIELRIE